MNMRIAGRLRSVPSLATAAVVLLCACHRTTDRKEMRTVQRDSAGITVVTISGSVSDLPVWSVPARPLIETGADSQPLLGAVGEVAFLSDGRLLVEEDQTSELYRFDATGRGSLVGRSGDGPGEFRSIDVLTVTAGDTVFAYDRTLDRVSVFDAHGELLRSTAINASALPSASIPRGVWAIDPDHLVLYSSSPRDTATIPGRTGRDQRTALLFPLDESGQPRSRTPVRFTGGYSISVHRAIVIRPFANTPIVATGRQHLVRGSGIQYELVVHDRDLAPQRIIRWSGMAEPLTPALRDSVRAAVESAWAEAFRNDPATAELFVNAIFDEAMLPDTLPALGSAIIDDRGRIWVSQFRPATRLWTQTDAWHVLDPNGRPLARLQLPPEARLKAVRGDTIAIVVKDEMDVQRLEIFELTRPDRR